jgi:hypothetical protein
MVSALVLNLPCHFNSLNTSSFFWNCSLIIACRIFLTLFNRYTALPHSSLCVVLAIYLGSTIYLIL